MPITHNLISLNNTTAIPVSVTGNHAGRDITIQNVSSSAIVYLGAEGVTAANYGYKIYPETAWSVELKGGDVLYAISSTTSNVAVIQLGLESFK
jgi:hypothetical protein